MMEILLTCDARYAYSKQNDDRYIYVQFANEQDLIEACTCTFYKGSYVVTGLPKDTFWTDRQAFLAKHKSCRYESPAIIAKFGLESSSKNTRDIIQKRLYPPVDSSSVPHSTADTQKGTYDTVSTLPSPSQHHSSTNNKKCTFKNKNSNHDSKGKAVF